MSLSVHFRNKDPMLPAARIHWLEHELPLIMERASGKFQKGMLEHKCDIGDQDVHYLLEAIEQEAIDTLFYITELKRRIRDRALP